MSSSSSTPLATYIGIFDRIQSYARMHGLDLQRRPDGHGHPITKRTRCFVALNVALCFSWLYTCCVADGPTVWRSSSLLPLFLQGLCKWHAHTAYAAQIADQIAVVRRIYECNADAHTANYWVLRRWSGRIAAIVHVAWLPVSLTAAMFVLLPVWNYWRYGELTMVLDEWIIGVDHRTARGYVVHLVFHLAAVGMGTFGTLGTDLTMLQLTLHVCPMTEIWCGMVRRLDRDLVANGGGGRGRSGEAARSEYLRHILDVHRDLDAYVRNMSQMYEYWMFAEFYTMSAMLCMLLYCFLMMHYMPALATGLMSLTILLMYCALGTVVELATDRVYAVLSDSEWVRLPLHEQRIVQLVLLTAQRPCLLMAGTLPLNMDSGVRALKTVYSVGMMLTQSVSEYD